MATERTPQRGDVDGYLAAIADPERRGDCTTLIGLMTRATGAEPALRPGGIVGFGTRRYRYDSGREGETVVLGFASRKPELVLYLGGALTALADRLDAIGEHRIGKGCLYLRRLADIDLARLGSLLDEAARHDAARG